MAPADQRQRSLQTTLAPQPTTLAELGPGLSVSPEDRLDPYLSPNQQKLLLAALNSQAAGDSSSFAPTSSSHHAHNPSADTNTRVPNMASDSLFQSPEGELNLDNTPDLDFDDSFDFDNADLGGEMIGSLPGGAQTTGSSDHAEKRKSRDEGSVTEGGDSKRQETEEGEKAAKKPGRKPLTTEPTTKRKAQNRAAQRAFRERKEKHVKDMETKITELTEAQEADKHENGLLKAQVERLQVELREYRKRLSLNSTRAGGGSPPQNAVNSQQRSNSTSSFNNGFQFDFPKFGGLPGSQIFGNDTFGASGANGNNVNNATPHQTTHSPSGSTGTGSSVQQHPSPLSRQNSAARSLSPQNTQTFQTNTPSSQLSNFDPAFTSYSTSNNMHGFASMLPQMNDTPHDDTFGGLFSPSILKSVKNASSGDTNYFNSQRQNSQPVNSTEFASDLGTSSTSGYNRAFQFNSTSSISGISDSASPASSMSQWNNNNGNSSCGTSPEPVHDSPANKEKPHETVSDKISLQDQNNKQQSFQNINNAHFLSQADFNVPSLDSFDPVLFGDYRDSNDAIVGGGDFTGGFFNDALEPFDYSSPSNLFGILQSPQQTKKSLNENSASQKAPSKQCMEACDKIRDGGDDDYGLPTAQPTVQEKAAQNNINLISCNSIWNQLQANTDFQEGKFDLDSLCSELRSKARCSESGVMVDQNHVDAALRKLGQKDTQRKDIHAGLMFEQESWEKVLQKMNNQQ
ncbi:PAP1-domain-containing protein [Polychaeton citri CBS 116435]|uniref:PAP1-domain-containing protein n=1 Tax=Polychaeton citri CBS 116435 TaxID=1314669 RepID=A0A9P4Q1N5_9PEZI|nr:PAP1-domain-containing protein [Polychaeton citri CBS 116435]